MDHHHPYPLCPVRALLSEGTSVVAADGSEAFVSLQNKEERGKTGLVDCGFRWDWIKPSSSIKSTVNS